MHPGCAAGFRLQACEQSNVTRCRLTAGGEQADEKQPRQGEGAALALLRGKVMGIPPLPPLPLYQLDTSCPSPRI